MEDEANQRVLYQQELEDEGYEVDLAAADHFDCMDAVGVIEFGNDARHLDTRLTERCGRAAGGDAAQQQLALLLPGRFDADRVADHRVHEWQRRPFKKNTTFCRRPGQRRGRRNGGRA